MRRTEPTRIGEIMGEYFRVHPRLSKLQTEGRAIEAFREAVGERIASCITRIQVYQGRMFVHMDSAIVRHEIFMRRTALTRQVNALLGAPVIRTIIVK